MASNAAIFFAGVGTTFLIMGAGFGGGMFMATSALQDSKNSCQARASGDLPAPIRVVLPASAQAAEPTEAQKQPAPSEQLRQRLRLSRPQSKRRSRRKELRSRKPRRWTRIDEKNVGPNGERDGLQHGRNDHRQSAPREAPTMAFGGDDTPSSNGSFNLFGN
jgi:hypothetical protein